MKTGLYANFRESGTGRTRSTSLLLFGVAALSAFFILHSAFAQVQTFQGGYSGPPAETTTSLTYSGPTPSPMPMPFVTSGDATTNSDSITNDLVVHTLHLSWPATGETNRVMVDGVQQALAWTNATVTNVTSQLHSLRIITLSGHSPYAQWGQIGLGDGEYRGVRYKVFTNGAWSAWQAWTNPVGTKLPQSVPPHLFEPDIIKPSPAWQRREEFPRL